MMGTSLEKKEETSVVTQKKTIRDLVSGDAFKDQVAMALPRHLTPERFIRVALTALNRTPALMQCTQQSLFQCLLDLSALGLEPDGRRAHLIPFNNRKSGSVICTLIVDYKGLAELVLRSGDVTYIHSDVVCENDEFSYNMGQIEKHAINFREPRGEVYAAYAIAKMKSGDTSTCVMSKEDVESIRKRSKAGSFGPWITDWNEMAKKTAFRRLSKWLPLSPEIREQIEADDKYQFNADIAPASKTPLESAIARAELMGIDALSCKTAKEVDELIAAQPPPCDVIETTPSDTEEKTITATATESEEKPEPRSEKKQSATKSSFA